MCRNCVQNLKIIENTLFEISATGAIAVLEKKIEFVKKPHEDGFQSLQNYQKWLIWKIVPKITSRLNTKFHVLIFLEAIL
jgi:uncharacterized protein YehS (DUF1456 family)